MGEPSLNHSVLDVLDELPQRYKAPGLMPSISTVAPAGTQAFFERLLSIKYEKYTGGRFQFQFSIHTTDAVQRDRLIPVKKWSFAEMAAYGDRFYAPGDRKVTLNFALAEDNLVDVSVLRKHFNPDRFLIKITPLNPTYRARENRLGSYLNPSSLGEHDDLIQNLRDAGYQVIISIGELEENFIGSNCGQYLRRHMQADERIQDGYTYQVEELDKK